jgi:putative transposase
MKKKKKYIKKYKANEYKSIAHAKTLIRYHIIFSTKYRIRCLKGIRGEVLEAFKVVESNSDAKILAIEVSDDHIHLLLKFKPSLSIEQIVRRIKQISTKEIWERSREYLRRYYYKKEKLWTGGYFCSTIGNVSEKAIRHYIANQG